MPEKLKRWDAVVIGGGLAGSSAAILLAQQGRDVLLIEKETAAHDKVCGEFISIEAQHYLNRLGLDVQSLGAQPITNIRLIHGMQVASGCLPFQAFSLSRRHLDEALLTRAAIQGATLQRGTTVTDLVCDATGWRIDLSGQSSVAADAVFLATGKHDLRGYPRVNGTQNNFIGFKMHVELSAPQQKILDRHIELILFNGGYAGLEPIENGKANLCLVVTKAHFARYGKDWEGLLGTLGQAHPPMAERLAGMRPCWPKPLAIFNIPYGFVYRHNRDAPANLYRLGDQMAVIPSFSGDGMSIALHTAFLGIDSYLQRGAEAYHHRARAQLLPQIRNADLLVKMMTSPWSQTTLVSLCRIAPELIQWAVGKTRIQNVC